VSETGTARKRIVLRAAVLAATAILAYAGSVSNVFVYDDNVAIKLNPVVNGEAPIISAFERDFWGNPRESTIGSYRPICLLSLAIDGRLSGMDGSWFHAINVLWHATIVVALYLVFRGIAGEATSLAAAALMAVLAAPSEAVQNIVGRADMMLAMFALIGLWAHRRPGVGGAALAMACLALGLGSKESAIALPLAWGALDLLLPPRPGAPRIAWRRFALYALPCGVYLLARQHALGAATTRVLDPVANPLVATDLTGRLLGASRVFMEHYATGLLAPARRLYDCSANACGPAGLDDPVAWAGVILLVAVAVAPLLIVRRAPVVAAGLAWFGLCFLPASNLVFLSPSAYGERLLYLPSIGLVLALTSSVFALAQKLSRPIMAPAILAVLGLANAAAIQVRNLDWKSEETLYLSALEVIPNSAKVQYNVAWVAFQKGEFAKAEIHASKAVAIRPTYMGAQALLAGIMDVQGRTQEAEAGFSLALSHGRDEDLVLHYGTFLARHGRYSEALSEVAAQRAHSPRDPKLKELQRRIQQRIADLKNEAESMNGNGPPGR
jgi:hypothetical protein